MLLFFSIFSRWTNSWERLEWKLKRTPLVLKAGIADLVKNGIKNFSFSD